MRIPVQVAGFLSASGVQSYVCCGSRSDDYSKEDFDILTVNGALFVTTRIPGAELPSIWKIVWTNRILILHLDPKHTA